VEGSRHCEFGQLGLTFTARLTVGSDYVRGGKEVPAHDVFTFDGLLAVACLCY
jgi:hypothetical protein